MIRVHLFLTLALVLGASAAAPAADEGGEGEGGSGEGSGTEGGEGSGSEEGKAGGEEGEDPNIKREDDEDTSQWTYEGEKKQVEQRKDGPKRSDLAPEPPADGLAGAWYEVTVDCSSCPTVLGQTLGVDEPAVMRQFYDQLVIQPDRKGGKIIYVNEGQNRPVLVLEEKGDRVLLAQYMVEQAARKTDVYAHIWDFRSMMDNRLLYGRKYVVHAFKDNAWTKWEKGDKADPAFLPDKQLQIYASLSEVQKLTNEKKTFDLADKARVEFVGMNAWVRSDFQKEGYARLQGEVQARQDAEKKRLLDQQRFLKDGDDKFDAKDYTGSLAAYQKSRELGLDNADLHFGLGRAFQKLERLDEAAAEYRWCVERDPKDTAARFNLARVYEKQNKLREALEQYQAVTRLDPTDEKAKEKAYDIALKLAGG